MLLPLVANSSGPERGGIRGNAMNHISFTKLRRLAEALRGGASLNVAARYAGVAKQTAMRYRLLLNIEPRTQNRWVTPWEPSNGR